MWELASKESWALKNGCFWTVVLEKTLESPLDCKELQPVHPKGDQSWVFIGRTDVEAETAILWPPDTKSWLIRKNPDAGRDWGQEEKGTTENEMVEWRHQLNGDEFEKTPGVGDGQGGLACYSPWNHEELDTTELLNWTELSDLTNRHLFTPSSRDQMSEIKVPANSLQSLPSEGAEQELPLVFFSSFKDTGPLWPHFILIAAFKAPSLNTVTSGSGLQHKSQEGGRESLSL